MGVPNTPYGMIPVLTYARDVPGLALGYQLPAIRLAIEVVEWRVCVGRGFGPSCCGGARREAKRCSSTSQKGAERVAGPGVPRPARPVWTLCPARRVHRWSAVRWSDGRASSSAVSGRRTCVLARRPGGRHRALVPPAGAPRQLVHGSGHGSARAESRSRTTSASAPRERSPSSSASATRATALQERRVRRSSRGARPSRRAPRAFRAGLGVIYGESTRASASSARRLHGSSAARSRSVRAHLSPASPRSSTTSTRVLASDLLRGESIAIPLALLVLFVVLGLSLALAIPFVFAACTIAGTLAAPLRPRARRDVATRRTSSSSSGSGWRSTTRYSSSTASARSSPSDGKDRPTQPSCGRWRERDVRSSSPARRRDRPRAPPLRAGAVHPVDGPRGLSDPALLDRRRRDAAARAALVPRPARLRRIERPPREARAVLVGARAGDHAASARASCSRPRRYSSRPRRRPSRST